jgi:hypothetical protein
MDIRVSGTKFQTPKSTASLAVSEATLTGDQYTTKAVANVTNPFAGDLTNLKIVCIVADAAGHYVGVGIQFLDLLLASSTGQAECPIDSREDLTGAASTRIFVGVSNITSFGTPPP